MKNMGDLFDRYLQYDLKERMEIRNYLLKCIIVDELEW